MKITDCVVPCHLGRRTTIHVRARSLTKYPHNTLKEGTSHRFPFEHTYRVRYMSSSSCVQDALTVAMLSQIGKRVNTSPAAPWHSLSGLRPNARLWRAIWLLCPGCIQLKTAWRKLARRRGTAPVRAHGGLPDIGSCGSFSCGRPSGLFCGQSTWKTVSRPADGQRLQASPAQGRGSTTPFPLLARVIPVSALVSDGVPFTARLPTVATDTAKVTPARNGGVGYRLDAPSRSRCRGGDIRRYTEVPVVLSQDKRGVSDGDSRRTAETA